VSFTLMQMRRIVTHDLDPEFIRSMAISLGWEYALLYEELASDSTLIGDGCRLEEFGKRRGRCGVKALVAAAQKHGVPFEFRSLECNGQHKLIVKAGRVILIQEPILSLSDEPKTADYKVKLADLYGFMRQLELDLGDQPRRIRDWSGCVLPLCCMVPEGLGSARNIAPWVASC